VQTLLAFQIRIGLGETLAFFASLGNLKNLKTNCDEVSQENSQEVGVGVAGVLEQICETETAVALPHGTSVVGEVEEWRKSRIDFLSPILTNATWASIVVVHRLEELPPQKEYVN